MCAKGIGDVALQAGREKRKKQKGQEEECERVFEHECNVLAPPARREGAPKRDGSAL